MDHVSRAGQPKLLSQCSLPLTGTNVVDVVITNLAVFACGKRGEGMTMLEQAPGLTIAELREKTGAPFTYWHLGPFSCQFNDQGHRALCNYPWISGRPPAEQRFRPIKNKSCIGRSYS